MNELVKGVLHVLETLRVHGGGLSEISGPLKIVGFVWFGLCSTDPDASLWSAAEAGRIWYNSTSHTFKFWNGASIQTLGVTSGGDGDMLKATYDINDNGKVDQAENADTLDSKHASDLALVAHQHPGTDITSAVATATDADTVDGKHASDFLVGTYDSVYRCLVVVK